MNTTCSVGLQKEKSHAYIHAESNKRLNFNSDEPESQSESEKELTESDVDGTRHLVKGSVQPRDVWNNAPGFRYFVQFNEFNQPLHKGGSILVSFLGDIAKREEFCPVGILIWHKLSSNMRGNIVNLVQKMSELGKAARASQVLVRKSGAKSFANRRAILEDAIKKVQESLDYSSSSIPKVDIENEVFNQLMYQGEIPKRPLNYGFGVMQSDIFGVEGHLRKEGSYYVNNSDMEVEKLKVALLDMKKQNEDVDEQNQILKTKFDAVGSMMAQVWKATRSGNVSSEVIDNAIQLLDSQVVDDVGSNGKE
uniref:Uncharacterized protein n=1 Tax=Chenopodium quinoa TaxID=63459 RepID=A0A803N646_CHEQI